MKEAKLVIIGVEHFAGWHLFTKFIQEGVPVYGVTAKSQSNFETKFHEFLHCEENFLFDGNVESKKSIQEAEIIYYFPLDLEFDSIDQVEIENFNLRLLISYKISKILKETSKMRKVLLYDQFNLETVYQKNKVYSHLEMDSLFKSKNHIVLTIKSSLVICNENSLFYFFMVLIQKVPIHFLPRWMEKQIQPLSLFDLIDILSILPLDHPLSRSNREITIAGPEILTYHSFKQKIRLYLKTRIHFSIPFDLQLSFLSKYFNRIATKLSKIEIKKIWQYVTYNQILMCDWRESRSWVLPDKALKLELQKQKPKDFRFPGKNQNNRVSKNHFLIQCCKMPGQMKIQEFVLEYFYWLPSLFFHLLRIEREDNKVKVFLPFNILCLSFELDEARSDSYQQSFFVNNGVLKASSPRARLIFTHVAIKNYHCVYLRLENYLPTYPKFIYDLTQAKIHSWVSHQFARYTDTI